MPRPAVLLLLSVCGTACGGGASATDAGPRDAPCVQPVDATPLPDAHPLDPRCIGTPCGGDPTGTWTITASCATGTGDGTFLGCKQGSFTLLNDFAVSGTFMIAADGTLTTNASEKGSGRAHLPLSCYPVSTCEGLAALGNANHLQTSCIDEAPLDPGCAASACTCDIGIDMAAVMLTGTLVTDPSAGTFTLPLGNETVPGEYCVQGDDLWMHGVRFGGVDYEYRFTRAP